VEYSDIMELVGVYLLFFAACFGVPYGAGSLWRFFRDLGNPHFKVED
jgi:hypothetical protein